MVTPDPAMSSLHVAPVSRTVAQVSSVLMPGRTESRSRSYGLKEARVQPLLNQPGPGYGCSIQAKILFLLLCALYLQGCSETTEAVRLVHTEFSESSGLTVTDGSGNSQQLIRESLGVRVVVSPNANWILVEDMQLSNLVVIRAFQYVDGAYREIPVGEIRRQWETLAAQAGATLDELIHPRVGIENFGPTGNSVLLHFQADTRSGSTPDIDSIVEIELDPIKN
jgi:hypothetical protein